MMKTANHIIRKLAGLPVEADGQSGHQGSLLYRRSCQCQLRQNRQLVSRTGHCQRRQPDHLFPRTTSAREVRS